MKNALISPTEKIYAANGNLLGERIADVATTEFEVAPPLFWVSCANDVVADEWYWTGDSCQLIPLPAEPEPIPVIEQVGPNVIA